MFTRTFPATHEVSSFLDMFTYYHLSCLLKFSFGGTLQEYELTEQYLPLNFSVCTVYVQGELELSCNEITCLATGMAVISHTLKSPLSSFVYSPYYLFIIFILLFGEPIQNNFFAWVWFLSSLELWYFGAEYSFYFPSLFSTSLAIATQCWSALWKLGNLSQWKWVSIDVPMKFFTTSWSKLSAVTTWHKFRTVFCNR